MRGLQYYNINIVKLQHAPTTSPGFGMGACHLGGSRFTETNLFIEDSFSPGIRSVLGAARQFFSPFSNPPSCGASIVGVPRFMGVR